MPLGIERLNVRKRPPNQLITFVKALDGEDNAIAQDFLERVAAVVYPIMRDNGLAVMSLDEFPANMEFWGRNFNAGECIQLVLKHPNTGLWLPFRFVQGVMIHELAHVKQMDHSSAFWSVNNKFSTQLSVLWGKGYTGEGFWSAGRTLLSERYTQDRPLAESDMPHALCGGTYRSRSRRRRKGATGSQAPKKPKLTYAERQQRRKERKFGAGEGDKVGADDGVRSVLEGGKKRMAAPRVAQSARGRELRAAAAIKRLEAQAQQGGPSSTLGDEARGGSGGESTGDDTDYDETDWEDKKAVDVGGGRYLIPISEEEDGDLEQGRLKRELLDLADACGHGTGVGYGGLKLGERVGKGRVMAGDRGGNVERTEDSTSASGKEVIDLVDGDDGDSDAPRALRTPASKGEGARGVTSSRPGGGGSLPAEKVPAYTPPPADGGPQGPSELVCTACSVANARDDALCAACANVLEPEKMRSAWRCPCYGELKYLNAGDAGVCGVCGQKKVGRS